MKVSTIAITLLIIGLAIIAAVGLGTGDFWEIDTCLDGGGSWDYDTQTCELGD